MTFTFVVALMGSYYPNFGAWCRHPATQIVSLVIMCPAMCTLFFVHKKVPLNYGVLSLVTICESIFVASLAAEFETQSVLQAIGAMCVTTGGLFIGALNTSLPERLMRNLCLAIVCGVIFQFFAMLFFVFGSPGFWLRTLYCCVGVMITGIYVVIDLVQIMKPDVFSMDEYILGALMLYVDLVRMFMYILILLGSKK